MPLRACIFAIVDLWDALRSDRPYCTSWPEAKVRPYLPAESGRRFDPDVVAAIMRLDLANIKPSKPRRNNKRPRQTPGSF